jgi:hypothetical protein
MHPAICDVDQRHLRNNLICQNIVFRLWSAYNFWSILQYAMQHHDPRIWFIYSIKNPLPSSVVGVAVQLTI